jgi:hypothetical protein
MPCSSVAVDHSELYPPEQVADAILSVPGMRSLEPNEPNWESWLARWEQGLRWMEISLNALENGDTRNLAWESSDFRLHCTLDDFLFVWRTVRLKVRAFWVHDTDTEMWSPDAFEQEARRFQSSTSGPEWRPGWGVL